MKTVLRSWLFLAFLTLSMTRLQAQCEVSNIYVQNVSLIGPQPPDSCIAEFDLSFTIENNNGNKYIFIHTWLLTDYPNYFNCVNGQPTGNGSIRAPKSADLVNSFLNIGINNDGDSVYLLNTYTPDPGVPMATADSIIREIQPDGSAIFILYGVRVSVPVPCGTPTVLATDLWSSQSARAQNAHCVNCSILNSVGFLSLAGLVNCASLTFNATITNNSSATLNGYYRVYADVNADGYFTPAVDTLIQDTTDFTVAAGAGMTTSISGTVPSANINQDLFILLTQTSGQASGASRVILIPSTQCSVLPVSFKSFSAQRTNRSNVMLRWETASEINNSGFALQRNIGANNWQLVNFIHSKAVAGNSDAPLIYSYNDLNPHNGISQYRIMQVDLDGRARFSDIRAVRGFGQSNAVIVYPNPSSDGRVNIVFEDEGIRDLTLTDVSGRAIRQWKSVSGNTFQAINLQPGFYTLLIRNTQTGIVQTEKIVISNN